MTHARASWRIFGGIALGAATAILVIMGVEALVHGLAPASDTARLGTVVAERPLTRLAFGLRLLVIAGWCLGSFAGGAVAAGIVGRRWAVWPVAVLVVVGVAETVAGYTHPAWMIALGLLAPWPCAWAAARFARHA